MDTLNTAHVNIRGFNSNKKYELANFLDKYNIHIFAITETWLKPGNRCRIPQYQVFRKDRITNGRGAGGALLLVHQNIATENITLPHQFATEEAVLCKITTPTINIHVVAHYNRPQNVLNTAFYQHLNNNYNNLIILGDLNAYATTLGDTATNLNGTILDQIITQHTNLSTLNLQDPQPTHIPDQIQQVPHILDYIIVSPNMLTKLNTFEVCPPDFASDHKPIFANFEIIPHNPTPQPQPRHNYKRANWPLYQQTLHQKCNQIIQQHTQLPNTTQNIDQLHDHIANAIQDSATETIPMHTPKQRKWWKWTPEMEFHRNAKNQAIRKYIRTQTPYFKALANHHERTKSRLITIQKQHDWQTFCSKLSTIEDPKQMHRTFKIFKKSYTNQIKSIPQLKLPTTVATTDPQKAQALKNSLQQNFQVHQGPQFDTPHTNLVNDHIQQNQHLYNPLNNQTQEQDDDHMLIANIQPHDIYNIVKHSKNKAPGLDKICNTLIRNGPASLHEALALLYNKSLQLGYTPNAWKHAKVIMIHKPDKAPSKPDSYRPISLLSTISKLMEKIIARRLLMHCENNNILPQQQSGFRKHRSTSDHLFRLSQQIQTGFKKGQKTLACFLDVAKAFDSVWGDGLRYSLTQLNLPPKLTRWISSFITNRQATVHVNQSTSDTFSPEAGVPQGSALSPILYNIYTRDMLENIHCRHSVFADDTALWATHKNMNILQRNIQQALLTIQDFCNKWRIKLNADKTQTILFIPSKHPNNLQLQNQIQLTFQGQVLQFSNTVKFLGITFDRTMTFKPHFHRARSRGIGMAQHLRAFRKGGSSEHSMLIIYKTHIRPILTYGSAATLGSHKTHINQLQIAQNSALRAIGGFPLTTYIDLLHQYFNIDTINQRTNILTQNFLNKNMNQDFIAQTLRDYQRLSEAKKAKFKSPLDILTIT